jgi:hypothetical protein
MKTTFTKEAGKISILLMTMLLLIQWGISQTVFTDAFNRASLSPGGTPSMTYSSTNTGTGSSAISGSSFLQISNGGSAGRS